MTTTEAMIAGIWSRLPVTFVPNAGQLDKAVQLYARGARHSVFLTPGEALIVLRGRSAGAALALQFLGADPEAAIEGGTQAPGHVSYFRGSDPSGWHPGLPTYYEAVYRNLWPGIDLVLRDIQGRIKYEFRLQPGARPEQIRLRYAGADGVALDAGGNLVVQTALGPVLDESPVAWQGAEEREVPCRFTLEADGEIGFALPEGYDPTQPLVIDPGLVYSTYLGGTFDDVGFGIAIDGAGNAYVTGRTTSADFPTTPGAFDPTAAGTDAFVTKLDPTGATLVYSTFLGGSSGDEGRGIAVDAAGNAYVTGLTSSPDFPVTPGAYDTTINGSVDVFVTKLNPTGTGLVYSTFLGGSNLDLGIGIAIDGAGSAVVTGLTQSTDFPTTPGAFQPTFGGVRDAFVSKLDPTGATLIYSTYLGGSSTDEGTAIASDVTGIAVVTGITRSSDFPTTPGAFSPTPNGLQDAFVTKFSPTGAVIYSTFLGGSDDDFGNGVAMDGAGNAYVTGATFSGNFPTTAGAFDTTHNGTLDLFVTKLDPTGTFLVYSTFVGGGAVDGGSAISVDAAGNAYVTGETDSLNFPITPDAVQPAFGGGIRDAFLFKLDPAGANLLFSTYLGGSQTDRGLGIKADPVTEAVYVTGVTRSPDFPTTPGAFDTTYNGADDAFVTKIDTAQVARGAGWPATEVDGTIDP